MRVTDSPNTSTSRMLFGTTQQSDAISVDNLHALEASRARDHLGLRIAHAGVFELNGTTGEVISQDYAQDMLGLAAGSTLNFDQLCMAVLPVDRPAFALAVRDAIIGDSTMDIEYQVVLPDQSVRWVQTWGRPVKQYASDGHNLLCISLDVTDRKLANQKIRHAAEHDALTGLVNRSVMNARLEQALLMAARNKTFVAVMFLDLDGFKAINDTLGHQVGDELLKQLANRLSATVRASDTVCRQSGDEFIVVMPMLLRSDDAQRCAEKIQHALAELVHIDGNALQLKASIGISCSPLDGVTAEDLLRHADMAMYAAKKHGGGQFEFFSSAVAKRLAEQQTMRADLRAAIEHGELTLFYQPQLHLKDRSVISLEALLRWRHPKHGLLLPHQFIPAALGSPDLMGDIEQWALDEACRQRKSWLGVAVAPDARVVLNVSHGFLHDSKLNQRLSSALSKAKLEPRYLGIEVSEALLIGDGADSEAAIAAAAMIRDMGIDVSMDCFGCKNLNLFQLARCPVKTIKLDRSLTQSLHKSEALAALVAVSALGKSLHWRVVAQAIETSEQQSLVASLGCDAMQGNVFCPPINAIEFSKFDRLLH